MLVICAKKAVQKLCALALTAPFMDVNKKRRIMKAFIESQFGYSPPMWMFCSRGLNDKINLVHERALRISHHSKSSSFGKVINENNSLTMYHRNLRPLATEIYKVTQGLSPLF